ncbi:hypothetical protein V8F06_001564 [Rhypophila decipiens]
MADHCVYSEAIPFPPKMRFHASSESRPQLIYFLSATDSYSARISLSSSFRTGAQNPLATSSLHPEVSRLSSRGSDGGAPAYSTLAARFSFSATLSYSARISLSSSFRTGAQNPLVATGKWPSEATSSLQPEISRLGSRDNNSSASTYSTPATRFSFSATASYSARISLSSSSTGDWQEENVRADHDDASTYSTLATRLLTGAAMTPKAKASPRSAEVFILNG